MASMSAGTLEAEACVPTGTRSGELKACPKRMSTTAVVTTGWQPEVPGPDPDRAGLQCLPVHFICGL